VRIRTLISALAVPLLAVTGLTACSGTGGGSDPNTITYWASNQGASLQQDKEVLTPELAEFTKRTGINVKLEVIDWTHLLDRITTAVTSGDGPDVVNIGNTWSASLQATGAFVDFDGPTLDKIGGKDKFLATSLSSTGAPGKTPASVPLYGLSYGLFYNKKAFAAAGITNPPATWAEFVADAKRLTNPATNTYGLTLAGGSYTESAHFAFIFGKQHGGNFFDPAGKATFATPQNVAAVKQYLDLIGVNKVAVPSSAEHDTTQDATADFAAGRAAMLMGQTNTTAYIAAAGMPESDYGVAPLPFEVPAPPGAERVNSHVAGINIAAFKDKNTEAALKFINFMTGKDEQVKINKKYGSLPVTKDAAADPAFQGPTTKIFVDVLANTSAPMPMITNESQFETTVGSAIKDLVAQIVGGKPVTEGDVQAALATAQQKLVSGG
jgi:multiple sugar transport system substrate-binding protein